MVYRAYIRKEVIFDGDDIPTGTEETLSIEDEERIWEAIKDNLIQGDEWIEKVE